MSVIAIAVPVRNEAERLPRLLEALVAQDLPGILPVALCVNNCDDGSVAIVETCAARHAGRLAIALDACTLAPEVAHVGTARGRAMDAAAALAEVIVTTDADCLPPPYWLSANLAAIVRGADLVGGRIVADFEPDTDLAIVAVQARLDAYWTQVRAIEDAIDPQPHDPPPRHGDHTGASLAIRSALYRAAGGVPALPTGEDRALVAAALAAGGRLVHPLDVWTRASARTTGRAPGGMAVAMADLRALLDAGDVPRLPAFDHWRRRAEWRLVQRRDPATAATLPLREAALAAMPCDMALSKITA